MDVLVPDDPVFQAKFQNLEQPLLRRLNLFQDVAGPESEDERVLLDAYDSWVRVLVKLPQWPQEGSGESGGKRAGLIPSGRSTYTLYDSRGERLTSLYPVEVSAADLGCLIVCLDLLTGADPEPGQPYRPDAGPAGGTGSLVDVLRRVVRVLLLPPPPLLLQPLRHVVPRGPVVSVTLREPQEAEYRRFCEEFVTILSSGDAYAYASHRAMYP